MPPPHPAPLRPSHGPPLTRHPPIVIGLDLGTTRCKAVALSAQGEIVASADRDYPLRTPRSGWVEQEAEAVWDSAWRVLQAVAAQVPENALVGLSLSGAMHSLLPVDATGQPLAPAMTWADQRAAPKARAFQERADRHVIYQRTGCPLQAIYHPAKLRWWIDEASEIDKQTTRYVALKDWVLFQLTGRWVVDYGLASTTGLLDIHRATWDETALALAGLAPDRLPDLVSPLAIVGLLRECSPDDAFQDSFTAQYVSRLSGLPVIAGSSDGGLANLGAGAVRPGQVVITVGTSGAVRRIVARPALDPLERTWCYLLEPERWFAGGAINNGGLALEWVRERFYSHLSPEQGYLQLLDDAAHIPPGADGVVLLPYFTGERSPHWASDARATLFGLRLEHTQAHVARAALEAVAFCLADVWEALAAGDGLSEPVRLTGGITRFPLWAQVVADILGVPLVTIEAADASAIGAAMLAFQALGIASMEDLVVHTPTGPVYEPDPDQRTYYADRHRMFQELYRRFSALQFD